MLHALCHYLLLVQCARPSCHFSTLLCVYAERIELVRRELGRANIRTGETLDQIQCLQLLGEGTYGKVYKGRRGALMWSVHNRRTHHVAWEILFAMFVHFKLGYPNLNFKLLLDCAMNQHVRVRYLPWCTNVCSSCILVLYSLTCFLHIVLSPDLSCAPPVSLRLVEGYCGCHQDYHPSCHDEWQGEEGEDGNHGSSHQHGAQPPQHYAGR